MRSSPISGRKNAPIASLLHDLSALSRFRFEPLPGKLGFLHGLLSRNGGGQLSLHLAVSRKYTIDRIARKAASIRLSAVAWP